MTLKMIQYNSTNMAINENTEAATSEGGIMTQVVDMNSRFTADQRMRIRTAIEDLSSGNLELISVALSQASETPKDDYNAIQVVIDQIQRIATGSSDEIMSTAFNEESQISA